MKRHKFNLSHYKIGSVDMGKLYPISCFEVLPGDTIQMHTSIFLRFAPMLAPVMHPIKVSTYSFFIPFRLLWNNGPGDNWEDFRTGGPDGADDGVPPTIQMDEGVYQGSLPDYLGVPLSYTGKFSAFPIRAYYKIYNEYFRDQDLIDPVLLGEALDGGNSELVESDGELKILDAPWEKDYFTTARPFPQKGPSVDVPVNGINAGTYSVNFTGGIRTAKTLTEYEDTSNNTVPIGTASSIRSTGNIFPGIPSPSPSSTIPQLELTPETHLKGSISIPANGTAHVGLDDLREALAMQRFEEHRAIYGSRYTEYLRFLGVRARDSRLNRPEYLGGGKSVIQISEVLQTGQDSTFPVGTLRGHGIGVNRGKTFRRFIEEDGLVMTLLAVRPIALYSQGLPKMFSREVKEDYWTKELEHIGQKTVLRKELYATGSDENDNEVFGYQNQYDEYRSVPSTVCGEMRDLLNYWHMAREFANAPVLNHSFINGSPTKRIFAEQTMNEIYFMASHSCVARRIMSKQGNPLM